MHSLSIIALLWLSFAGATRSARVKHARQELTDTSVSGSTEQMFPIIPAYQAAASVVYAVKLIQEARFRNGGMEKQTDMARSHIDVIKAVMNEDKRLGSDGWLALKGYANLLQRATPSCKKELDGNWAERSVERVQKWFGHQSEDEDDQELKDAVDMLRSETVLAANALANLAETSLCPALAEEIDNQLQAADAAAQAYTRSFGRSLYHDMALDVPINMSGNSSMAYISMTYADIMPDSCFTIDADSATDDRLRKSEDQRAEFKEISRQLFDKAEIFFKEMLAVCPKTWKAHTSDKAYATSMCVPDLRDALAHADMMAAFSQLKLPRVVQKWLDASQLAMNAIWDLSAVWDVAAGSVALSTSWVFSLAWLGSRAADNLPITEECISAARHLTAFQSAKGEGNSEEEAAEITKLYKQAS